MAHRPRWIDLRVGLVSTAVLVAVATAILVFGRVGTLHGKTFKLYVTTNVARGVIRGTEVWLDGQKVGLVHSINFRPAGVSANERLVLVLDVMERARGHVRMDSHIQVRSGGTLVGDQVVYLTTGTSNSPEVSAGDTVRAGRQNDTEGMSGDAALAARDFPPILENVKLIAAQLKSAEGTLGAFGLDNGGSALRRVAKKTNRLLEHLSDSTGSVGAFMGAVPDFQRRATLAMARFDSIRALLASDDRSLGRFRRDSTLVRDVQHVRAELLSAQRAASSTQGTVGRLRTDSSLVVGVHAAVASLDSLFADMKQHPLHYIAF